MGQDLLVNRPEIFLHLIPKDSSSRIKSKAQVLALHPTSVGGLYLTQHQIGQRGSLALCRDITSTNPT